MSLLCLYFIDEKQRHRCDSANAKSRLVCPKQWCSQNAEKSYAHQRETTGSIIDSQELYPFLKLELLFKERICCQRERILSFKSSSLWIGKSLSPHLVSSLECCYFLLRICVYCVVEATAMPKIWIYKKIQSKVQILSFTRELHVFF